jgi:hypothetical protein
VEEQQGRGRWSGYKLQHVKEAILHAQPALVCAPAGEPCSSFSAASASAASHLTLQAVAAYNIECLLSGPGPSSE